MGGLSGDTVERRWRVTANFRSNSEREVKGKRGCGYWFSAPQTIRKIPRRPAEKVKAGGTNQYGVESNGR